MVKIDSMRFGNIEISEQEIINFSEGLLGFEDEKQFCLVDPNDSTLILWLQSLKTPTICFPIIEPNFFTENSDFTIPQSDLANLEIETSNKLVFNILTIPSDATQISANLKAPIVINNSTRLAKQIVLQDNKLSVNENIYDGLKKSISSFKNNQSTNYSSQISQKINTISL